MLDAWSTRWRDLATAGLCALVGWAGLVAGAGAPVLELVDLGFHELGHLVCYILDVALPVPVVLTAAAGSIAQVAVPVGLALYFLARRADRTGAAACLAWAATSAAGVAAYVADAPYQRLPLIGGEHDWATILGPAHLDALGRAAALATTVRSVGYLLLAGSLLTACWPLVRAALAPDPAPTGPRAGPPPGAAGQYRV